MSLWTNSGMVVRGGGQISKGRGPPPRRSEARLLCPAPVSFTWALPERALLVNSLEPCCLCFSHAGWRLRPPFALSRRNPLPRTLSHCALHSLIPLLAELAPALRRAAAPLCGDGAFQAGCAPSSTPRL